MKRAVLYGGAAVIGVGLVYLLVKKPAGQTFAGSVGYAAAEAVGDAAVGVVKGVGSFLGVPDTSQDQCTRDLAAGNHWDASFSCPASRFISNVFNSTTSSVVARQNADTVAELSPYDAMGNYIGQFTGNYGSVVNTGGATGSW